MVLAVMIVAGCSVPGYAVSGHDHHDHHDHGDESHVQSVDFTRVDNSEVSVNMAGSGRTEITGEEPYADTDVVRASIILSKTPTIRAGFAADSIASNKAAVSYRDSLKRDQADLIARIEKATRSELDVVWNLTLIANLISVDVEYGKIKTIEKLPGVKAVVLENQYLPCDTEECTVAPTIATSFAQICMGTTQLYSSLSPRNRTSMVFSGSARKPLAQKSWMPA